MRKATLFIEYFNLEKIGDYTWINSNDNGQKR
jgi:hypothetical protein